MSSFQGVGIEEFTVYRGVLISEGLNRGVHCIQRCPHFRGLEYRSSTVYRGVLISGSWNREIPLYKEVSSDSTVYRVHVGKNCFLLSIQLYGTVPSIVVFIVSLLAVNISHMGKFSGCYHKQIRFQVNLIFVGMTCV